MARKRLKRISEAIKQLELFEENDVLQKTCFDVLMASEKEIATFFSDYKEEAVLLIYPGAKNFECVPRTYIESQLNDVTQNYGKCKNESHAVFPNFQNMDHGLIVKLGASIPKYV